jgi:hypothetical protein
VFDGHDDGVEAVYGMSEQPAILYSDLRGYLEALDRLADRELMTLKGHLLLEVSLRRLLAVRLGAAEEDVPRLSFPSMVRLVAAGANPEQALPMERHALLLNQIRNDIAHRLSPRDQLARMREFVVAVLPKRPWSEDVEMQEGMYRDAIKVLIMEAQLVGLVLQMKPAELASIHQKLAAARHE